MDEVCSRVKGIPREPKEARRIKRLIAAEHRYAAIIMQRNLGLIAVKFVSVAAVRLQYGFGLGDSAGGQIKTEDDCFGMNPFVRRTDRHE